MSRIKELQERGISLKDALEDDAVRLKNRKGIQKRATLVKAGAGGDLSEGSPLSPSESQLTKINQFTRRAVSADEVVAFKTYSCNDMPDRDDDQFVTNCVKGFASLEGPFSSVGKSYMTGHDYSKLATGRIFDVGVEKVNGVTFLTNEVYIPNTEANQPFIEGIDFGINWAVSVGVMLSDDECSICKSPFSSWGWWCSEGHDKGMYYDPKSEEVDSWGYPVPVEPDTSGAVKCLRKFNTAKDFYELSQVFLGAQYDAQIGKGIAKAASALQVPILGVSAEEARGIEMAHEPDEVTKARSLYNVKQIDDGSLRWVDSDSLVWTFDANSPNDGIMSLGKSSEDESNQEEDHARNSNGDEQEVPSVSERREVEVVSGGSEGAGIEEDHSKEGTGQDVGNSGEVIQSTPETESEQDMDKAAVLKAANIARLPHSVIEKVADAEGNGLAALLSASATEIQGLTVRSEENAAKAILGDRYVKTLRADAIDWYTKAHATGTSGVNVDTLNKMLDRFGDDIDLINSVIEENRAMAQAKFPAAVRRSSFPTDPNAPDVPEALKVVDNDDETSRFAKKMHG